MESTEPKKYPPTSKKLKDLRKKGQFPKTEFSEPNISIIFFVLVMSIFIIIIFSDFKYWVEFLMHADLLIALGHIENFVEMLIIIFAVGKLVFFIFDWVLINRLNINNETFSFKIEKINPVEGFKNNLGFDAIVNSSRKVLELLFLLFLMKYVFDIYGYELNEISQLANVSYFTYSLVYYIVLVSVFMLVYGICMGVVDYMFEYFRFIKKNRMTMTEMKNEMKDTEGSPQIKAERKMKMRELSNEPMTKGRRPTFAVANPTHILVPICFEHTIDAAPLVLEIYTDTLALERRQYLESMNIPIVENVSLARGILNKMKEGNQFIDKEFYRDIALIIVALKRNGQIADN